MFRSISFSLLFAMALFAQTSVPRNDDQKAQSGQHQHDAAGTQDQGLSAAESAGPTIPGQPGPHQKTEETGKQPSQVWKEAFAPATWN